MLDNGSYPDGEQAPSRENLRYGNAWTR